jgi:hypothetical protein
MFLIQDQAEILAETQRGIGYSTRLFYEAVKWRDKESSIVRTLTTQFFLITLVPLSTIESVVKAPLAFLIAAFSSHSVQCLHVVIITILTPAYACYAALLNPFALSISNQVVHMDICLRLWQKDELLFSACEEGRKDLAKHLLELGANPHRIIRGNMTSALVPKMMGYLELEHLFKQNDYENELIKLKAISQWLGLAQTVDLQGESVLLDGAPSLWMFNELAEAFQQFRTDSDFAKLTLPPTGADQIQDALFNAYIEKSSSVIARRIRNKALTFIASGWQNHAICAAFYKGYLAISNRGDGSDKAGTLRVFKIDPKRVTTRVVDEILMHQLLDKSKGVSYFYEKLPIKLSATNEINQDVLCQNLESIAPPKSEVGTCALDSKIGSVRFAWAMELNHQRVTHLFEKARLESDLFVSWAGAHSIDNKSFRDLFPSVEPKDLLYAQIRRQWNAKCAQYRKIRSCLGLGLIGGYM